MLKSIADKDKAARKPRSRLNVYGLVTLAAGLLLVLASLTVPALYSGAYGLSCMFLGVLLAHVGLVLLIVAHQLSIRNKKNPGS